MTTHTRAVVLCALFVAAATIIARAEQSSPRPTRMALSTLPGVIGSWQGRAEPDLDARTLAALGVDDHVTRAYFGPGVPIGLYVGFWSSQRQGDTIHSPLNCLPGSGWEPVSRGTLQMTVTDGVAGTRPIAINRYVVEKGLDRELILYWYQSHGRVVASEYAGKVYLVADALRFRRTDAALVRVAVRITSDADAEARAERSGIEFIQAMFPVLTGYLPS